MEICTNEHPIRFTYNNVPIGEKKTFPKDMHAEYEMLLFLEGGFSYVVEDRKYPVMPYTLILVPPNTYHFAVPKGEGVYCRYMLAFKAQAVDADLPEKAFAQSGCYQLEENHPVVQAFRQLHALRTDALADYDDLLLRSACTQILLGILARQRMPEMKSSAQQTLSYPLVDYIDKNLTTIRSTEEIAAYFCVSASTISHHFKSRMGISLMQYIRQKRLILARSLLEKGEKPQKAAEKAGFQEYTTCYKAYIRYFGIAPSR